MNRESFGTLVVAVLCMLAVSLSATSLDSTLGTDPDDVVDLEYEKLPIGKDDAGDLKRQVESNKEDGQGDAGEEGDTTERESDASGSDSAGSAGTEDQAGGGDASGTAGGGGDNSGTSGGGGPGDRSGSGPATPPPPPQLLDYLPWLLLLLVLGLASRYRRRLLALALALPGVFPGPEGDGEEREAVTAQWCGVEPSNEVHRAWLAMVRAVPVERPWTRTPSECADLAREAGADEDAVEQITRTFAEVRYGGRPVTDERRQRAREGIERLRNGGESP